MAENASPLGPELSVVRWTQLQKQIGPQTRLNPTVTNRYSGRKIFEAGSSGLIEVGENLPPSYSITPMY